MAKVADMAKRGTVVAAGAPVKTEALAVVEPTIMSVLQRAVQDGASVDVLERLLGLQERWEATQARKAFDAAMAALRANLPTIIKARTVDFTTAKGRTNYRYEDLASVTEIVSPAMAAEGLSFRWQTDSSVPGAIAVTCIISHAAGHAERTTLSAAADQSGNKNDIQAIGSAVTYLQRYTLKAALGIAAAVDDDGQLGRQPAPAGVPPVPPAGHHATERDPISDAQRKRLWVILKKSGRADEVVKAWLFAVYGLQSTKQITRDIYEAVCTAIEAKGPLPIPREPGSDDE